MTGNRAKKVQNPIFKSPWLLESAHKPQVTEQLSEVISIQTGSNECGNSVP